jgi:Domain of Unknown Function (DUF1080)
MNARGTRLARRHDGEQARGPRRGPERRPGRAPAALLFLSMVLPAAAVPLLACGGGSDFHLPPGATVADGGGTTPSGSGGAAARSGGASGTVSSGGSGGSVDPASSGGSVGSGGNVGSPGTGGSNGSGGSARGGSIGAAGATGSGGSVGAGGAANRVVLFDGTNLNQWQSLLGGAAPWRLVAGEGSVEVVPGTKDIITKLKWENVFVHLEYMTPMLPTPLPTDIQLWGNSGVYLKSAYEMQILDTHTLAPFNDRCGAVYGVKEPIVSACFQQLVWNTYEIEFKAPTYNAQGTKLTNARITSATLNGMLVQSDTEVPGTTRAGQPEAPGPQPLMLQDHNNLVRFRNIWVIPR